jgi:cytochrome P450
VSLPPGPSLSPIRQTLWWLRDPLGFLETQAETYGPGAPFTMRRVGGMTLVMVSDPEHVKAVFHGHETFLAGKAQEGIKRFLGENSLIGIDGPQHKRHRRLMLPPFHGARMKAYGALMRDVTLADLERWPVGRTFSLLEPLTRITLEIIFRAIFGLEDPARIARLSHLLHKLGGKGRAALAYLPVLQVDLGRLSPWGRFLRTQAEFDRMLLDAIASARAAAGSGREDILFKLLEEGGRHEDPLSDEEVRDELVTLLVAGHETTTSSLAWTLQWVLGLEPVRERLHAELREVVGGGTFEPEMVDRLPYLKACILEGLRLHPPIPSVGRWVAEPVALGGFELEPGHYCCPVPHLTQRMPALYPEPRVFRPDRFLDAERRSPFEFYPFGGGRRVCIGQNFAVYEMQVMLATILTHLELRSADSPTFAGRRKALLVIPRNGAPAQVVGRRGASAPN